jgi:hypothetical protein
MAAKKDAAMLLLTIKVFHITEAQLQSMINTY